MPATKGTMKLSSISETPIFKPAPSTIIANKLPKKPSVKFTKIIEPKKAQSIPANIPSNFFRPLKANFVFPKNCPTKNETESPKVKIIMDARV